MISSLDLRKHIICAFYLQTFITHLKLIILGSSSKIDGNTSMLTTVMFRLHPSDAQKIYLNEIFTVYNRIKRKGYNFLFNGETRIQQKLMRLCHNNPYVNTIMTENQTKLDQQKTWLEKQKNYLLHKVEVVKGQIIKNKAKNSKDRSLKGLYAYLSSLQNRLMHLTLRPVTFGTKTLFRERIRGKTSRDAFKIRRDASFGCIGKTQHGVQNNNLKILPSNAVRIATFHKERGNMPRRILVPFSVNAKQELHLAEILQLDKYTVIIKRKLVRDELRYYADVSYETPEPATCYGFQNGAIGVDFNYNFIILVNIDPVGNFQSYQRIPFRNLHYYRKGRQNNYASFKLEKVIQSCLNKGKGLIIEDLFFEHTFSYNTKRNRKLAQLKISMLQLLERKCVRRGIAVRKVHPAYTSIIGALKYGWSYNLSDHVLASYVIARRGLGFTEALPACYEWVLAQVGDVLKPRLKPSSPYWQWAQLYELFKHYGVTPFRSPDPTTNLQRNLLVALDIVLDGLNPATGVPPDNLTTGLLAGG